jgi:hypothetical protein
VRKKIKNRKYYDFKSRLYTTFEQSVCCHFSLFQNNISSAPQKVWHSFLKSACSLCWHRPTSVCNTILYTSCLNLHQLVLLSFPFHLSKYWKFAPQLNNVNARKFLANISHWSMKPRMLVGHENNWQGFWEKICRNRKKLTSCCIEFQRAESCHYFLAFSALGRLIKCASTEQPAAGALGRECSDWKLSFPPCSNWRGGGCGTHSALTGCFTKALVFPNSALALAPFPPQTQPENETLWAPARVEGSTHPMPNCYIILTIGIFLIMVLQV